MMYFPIQTDADKQLPCFLCSIGRSENQESITRKNTLPFHQLLFVTHGAGVLEYDGKTVSLPQGACWFIRKHTPHHYHGVSQPFTTRWLGFDGDAADSLQNFFSVPSVCCFTPHQFSSLRRQHQSLLEATAAGQPSFELSALLYTLLSEAFNEINSVGTQTLEPLRTWICEHYAADLSLEDMARQAGMNKYTLCRIFRREYGLTPFSFLINVRLQKAKELLAGRKDLTIRDISRMIGFHDHAYFGRLFREREGVTPLCFRKNFK